MKRVESLVPLSHDHHQGLILAQLMSKNAPLYETLPNGLPEKRDYAISKYHQELVPHFENEENILFPKVKGYDAELDALIGEILAEHKQLHELFLKLENSLDFTDVMYQASELLNSHIRKEERYLFQLIQERVPHEILTGLEGQIPAAGGRCGI